jgi:hypothetical protein
MPVTKGEYELKPGSEPGKYKVVNTVTGEVHAKDTSHADAMHQRRLLYAVAHGWTPANADHHR